MLVPDETTGTMTVIDLQSTVSVELETDKTSLNEMSRKDGSI
jgi:hypothetical protein